MPETTRRKCLLAAFAVPFVSGCSSKQKPPLGLKNITIVNGMDSIVTIQLTVEKDGNVIHDKKYSIHPEADSNQVEIQADWMGERVPYTVTVTRNSENKFLTKSAGSDSIQVDGKKFLVLIN